MSIVVPAGFNIIERNRASRAVSGPGVYLNISKSSVTIRGGEANGILDTPFYISQADDGRVAILPDKSGQFKWNRHTAGSGRVKTPSLTKTLRHGSYIGQLDEETGWWIFTPVTFTEAEENGSFNESEE